MGSSGGGSMKSPNMPTPSGTQVPYGQTSPNMAPQPSFLPTDPTQMATGLSPQMLAQIAAASPPEMLRPAAPPPPLQGQGQQDMRAMLAKMMSQNDRERADALDGGYFSGTNQRRQEILRNNRQKRPGESASGGSRAQGSAGGGGGDAWGGMR